LPERGTSYSLRNKEPKIFYPDKIEKKTENVDSPEMPMKYVYS